MFVCLVNGSPSARQRLERWRQEAWPEGTVTVNGPAVILTDRNDAASVIEVDGTVGSIDGLTWSDLDNPSHDLIRALKSEHWPLPAHVDGSFAAFAARSDGAITLALDPMGLRRAFMARTPDGFAVSSLQVPLAAALKLSPDAVGVAQVLGTNHTIGRRTLFKGIVEALPGECWRLGPNVTTRIGCEHAITEEGNRSGSAAQVARSLALDFQHTATAMASQSDHLGIALSGGLDSRLVLGALASAGRVPEVFAWGSPGDYETSIIERCAAAAGATMSFLDLEKHMFPPEDAARAFALRTESLLHPGWLGLVPLINAAGCDVVALGNVTDSYQVRIGGLWSRRARTTRAIRRAAGLPARELSTQPGYRSAEEWWENLRHHLITKAVDASRRYRIDASETSIRDGVASDLWEWMARLAETDVRSAERIEDVVHLLRCRQVHGSQPQSVTQPAVGVDLTASRHLGRAALAIAPSVRADRELLHHLARAVLPASLARIPTATIPVAPATSPWAVQATVWGARYALDQALRRANAATGGRTGRDRLLTSLDLYRAYRHAGDNHYLGSTWGRSGRFDPQPFIDEFLAIVDGKGTRPMYPFRLHLAVRVDTMLARDGER